MVILERLEKPIDSKIVHKLLRAFYGLKQSPKMWYQWLIFFLIDQHFKRNDVDINVYIN
jgi:hypothetical protein